MHIIKKKRKFSIKISEISGFCRNNYDFHNSNNFNYNFFFTDLSFIGLIYYKPNTSGQASIIIKHAEKMKTLWNSEVKIYQKTQD